MQRFSPRWLTDKFDRCKARQIALVRRLDLHSPHLTNVLFLLAFSLGGLGLYEIGLDRASYGFAFNSVARWMFAYQKGIILIFIAQILNSHFRWQDITFYPVVTLLYYFILAPWDLSTVPLAWVHFFPMLFYAAMIASHRSVATKIGVCVTVALVLNFLPYVFPQFAIEGTLPRARQLVPFFLLFAEDGYRTVASSDLTRLIFPTMLINPTPIERSALRTTCNRSRRARGLVGLLLIEIHIGLLLASLTFKAPPDLITGGFVIYLRTYLISYVCGSAPVALMRLCGFHLKADDFDYPLLATTPVERWKKWNFYYYNFFLKVIFIPMGKYLQGALFVPLGCCFLVLFLLNRGVNITAPDILWHAGGFFFAHFILVYLFARFRIRFDDRLCSSWLGVILTLVLMAMLHWWGANTLFTI